MSAPDVGLTTITAWDAAEQANIAAEAAYWAGRADQSVIVMDRYLSDLADSIARHPSTTTRKGQS